MMGKYQTCRECHCDFVGPNSSIGENLCGDCGDVIHGDCYIENSALKTRVAELKGENARLRRELMAMTKATAALAAKGGE